jgi:lysophospholipase L1-like esterase
MNKPASGLDQCGREAGWGRALRLIINGETAESGEKAEGVIGQTAIGKVLFLGNSITLHGPLESIGWSGNWGMAASEQSNDYVHLLTKHIADASHKQPEIMVRNIADFERDYQNFDIQKNLEAAIAFEADLIIIAIGENVSSLATEKDEQDYEAAVTALLHALHAKKMRACFVRSTFWSDAAKDKALSRACDATGATFVNLGKLDADETHFANSERHIEHAGVGRHPGDKGMKAIADGLWSAIEKKLPK